MERPLLEDELDEIRRRIPKRELTLTPRGPRLLGFGEAFGLTPNPGQRREAPGGLTQLLGGAETGGNRLAATAPAEPVTKKAQSPAVVKPVGRASEPAFVAGPQSPVGGAQRVRETGAWGPRFAKPTAPMAAAPPVPVSFAELTDRRTAFERELERWSQADEELVRAVSAYNRAHKNAGHTPAEAARIKGAAAALQSRLDTHFGAYRRLQEEARRLEGSGRRLRQNAPVGAALFELDGQIRELSGVGRRTPKQQDSLLELQRGRDYLLGMQRFAQERRLGARAVKVDESGIQFGEPKVQAQFVDWLQRKATDPKEHWAVNLFMKGAGLVGPATTEQVKSWLGGNQQALRQVEKEAGPEPAPPGYWLTERQTAAGKGPRRADYEGVERAFGVERPVKQPAATPPLPANTTVGHHRRAQIDALNWANQSRFANNPDVLLRLVKQGEDAKFHGPSELSAELARHLRAEEIDYYQRLHARNKYVSGRLRDLGAKELSNPLSLGGAVLFDRSLMRVAGGAGKATGGIGLQVLERKAPGLWRELTGQVGAQELRRGALPTLQRFGGRWLIAGSEGAGSLPVLKAGGSTATGKLENIPHDLATGPIEGAGSGIGGAIGRPITSKLPRALWLWAEPRGRGTLGHATGEIASRSLDNGLGIGLTSAAETAFRPTLNPEPGERRHVNLDPKQLLTSFRDGGLEGTALGLVGMRRHLKESLRRYPGEMAIRKGINLAPEQRRWEEQFAAQVERNPRRAIETYREGNARTINSDKAKELFQPFASETGGRAKYDAAVYEPAGSISRSAYDDILRNARGDERPLVFFLAGGPGSGKSTFRKTGAGKALEAESAAVVDSTLSNEVDARDLVSRALASGKQPNLVYVHRPIKGAVEGAITRALDKQDGRATRLLDLGKAHFGAQQTFPKLIDHFGDRVSWRILDNSGAGADLPRLKRKEFERLRFKSEVEAIDTAVTAYKAIKEARARAGNPIPSHIDRALMAGLPTRYH
ncbi:MAG: hypothetical protein ACO1SX_20125 [Actinomycetota bacterium]